MTCQDNRDLMMAYLDGELGEDQRRRFQEHLSECPACTGELKEFKSLKHMTDNIALAEPEDRIWQHYWDNVYNRVERGIGWVLFSVAGICLVLYGGFKLIEEIVSDPSLGIFLKVSLFVLIVGVGILLVSILRERLYFRKRDRYREVRR